MAPINAETKLVSIFKYFDLNGDGTLSREELGELCKQLDPVTWTDPAVDGLLKHLDKEETGSVNYQEFAAWIVNDTEGQRVMTIYEEAVAKAPGERLGDGELTDAGVERIRTSLNNGLDITPEEYTSPKVNSKLTWLQDVIELLDPSKNPNAYRMCQRAAIERGNTVGPLLGLAREAHNDAVVKAALEVLTRMSFGCDAGAALVCTHEDFLPTLHSSLQMGKPPEKLSTLQLAQTLAASSSSSAQVLSVIPQLLSEVVPLLSDRSFLVLPQAAFDVLVSCSFSNPFAVAAAVPLQELSAWLAEDSSRPCWLNKDNLTTLAAGLLVANILGAMPLNEESSPRSLLLDHLTNGPFLEFFALAAQAAVDRREWPAHSCAYHSMCRLASTTLRLLSLGLRRQLQAVILPFVRAVEISMDEHLSRSALRILRLLAEDHACLQQLLQLNHFRTETLDMLHKTGDEPEATELLSVLEAAETQLTIADTTLLKASEYSGHLPSVHSLAELFNKQSPLDGQISMEQVLQLLPQVPVGPRCDVAFSLEADKKSKFSFSKLAERIYGSPTVLGWWPSLMEEACGIWKDERVQKFSPPSFPELLAVFELGARGTSGITAEAILHDVLPAWNLPVEGLWVEDLFAEIHGDIILDFRSFTQWMARLFEAVDTQKKQEELERQQQEEQQ